MQKKINEFYSQLELIEKKACQNNQLLEDSDNEIITPNFSENFSFNINSLLKNINETVDHIISMSNATYDSYLDGGITLTVLVCTVTMLDNIKTNLMFLQLNFAALTKQFSKEYEKILKEKFNEKNKANPE